MSELRRGLHMARVHGGGGECVARQGRGAAGAVHARNAQLLLLLHLTSIPTEAAFAPTLLAGIAVPSDITCYICTYRMSCRFHNLLGVPLQHGNFISLPAFQLCSGKPHCSPPAGPRPSATAHRPAPAPRPPPAAAELPPSAPRPAPGPPPELGVPLGSRCSRCSSSPVASSLQPAPSRAGDCPVSVPAR